MTKSLFLSNLILAIIWVMATGTLTEENFLFGFFISFTILWVITFKKEERKYFTVIPKLLAYIAFIFWEIIKANFQSLKESFYPKSKLEPAIVKVPLDAKTDVEISILSNIISLTPGTLIMDVSDDKKVVYVHVMHLLDKENFIKEIKLKFEKPLLELMR
ncbi:Na+/H+ antiporter subunit E [Aquiflexum gelatinilyticum]|jgi:multicomponent Na+:H+ antiporter subunit E|uniref:Na+/H+ antiporter subunit E n=1 Tax=Aquiflexum gelatinilyticum TaxID=2961943 RepID=A0A9X2P797_9BACT|nr:Na+/H+ antiporter subunit E [Aquiflexum gelatinilyticum]MCR9017486.1 Na+/H+ antiporter subunit E [Aquiflexum gelatinilyticum]MCS4434650.1 Na+/H+ antiporter subunit E [Aquiflexum gelatinilyticum]